MNIFKKKVKLRVSGKGTIHNKTIVVCSGLGCKEDVRIVKLIPPKYAEYCGKCK